MSGIAIFGCKSTTRFLVEALKGEAPIRALVTIPPGLAADQEVADYADLSDVSGDIEVRLAERYNLKTASDRDYFRDRRFDAGFVIGWQRLIPGDILETFPRGVFGMHGSTDNLPFGRGRSPMNWSLIEDRRWFTTNLFRYSPGTDDGPIAASATFSITPQDTAETLHFKNLLAMVALVRENLAAIVEGSIPLTPQAAGVPTYYPKREPDDGIIDWGQDVHAIDRHIRAVSRPFAGAFSFLADARVVFHRAAILYTDVEHHPFRHHGPGEVCAVFPNGKFCVRCLGGVLIVHESDGDRSGQVAPGVRFHSPAERIRAFPRNRFGRFDLPAAGSDPT